MKTSTNVREEVLQEADMLRRQAPSEYKGDMAAVWALCSIGYKCLRESDEIDTLNKGLLALDMAWSTLISSKSPDAEKSPDADFFMTNFGGFSSVIMSGQQKLQSKIYGFTLDDFGETKPLTTEYSVLLLRSFTSDRRHFIPNKFDPNDTLILRYPKEPHTLTLEASLMRVIAHHYNCYAVGGVFDPRGMGRLILVEKGNRPIDFHKWREVVADVVSFSSAIFMLPSDTEGVRWELDYIKRNGFSARTILIMLPESALDNAFANWKDFLDIAQELGFVMPEYRAEGAFLRLSQTGSVQEFLPFASLWNGQLLSTIEEICSNSSDCTFWPPEK